MYFTQVKTSHAVSQMRTVGSVYNSWCGDKLVVLVLEGIFENEWILAFCPHATCALGQWSLCKTAARRFYLKKKKKKGSELMCRHVWHVFCFQQAPFCSGGGSQNTVALMLLCSPSVQLSRVSHSYFEARLCHDFPIGTVNFKSSAIMNPTTCCFLFMSSICPNITMSFSFRLSDTWV